MNKEAQEVEKSENIEVTIKNYIRENFKYTEQEINGLTIQKKMSLVSMKSQDKWSEFKLSLRVAGYII